MKIQIPAEFDIIVHVVNEETGQHGKVTIGVGAGEPPSLGKVQERIEKFANEELEQYAPGFRLATKREFWDAICLEKTGKTFALPGGNNFDD